jgi:hypothetical protein
LRERIEEVVIVEFTVSSFIVLVDPRSVEIFIVENSPLRERIEDTFRVEFTVTSFIETVDPSRVEIFIVEN